MEKILATGMSADTGGGREKRRGKRKKEKGKREREKENGKEKRKRKRGKQKGKRKKGKDQEGPLVPELFPGGTCGAFGRGASQDSPFWLLVVWLGAAGWWPKQKGWRLHSF